MYSCKQIKKILKTRVRKYWITHHALNVLNENVEDFDLNGTDNVKLTQFSNGKCCSMSVIS